MVVKYKKYNKLVRDEIPKIISNSGGLPEVKTLDGESYFSALNQKLSEEVGEYLENYDVDELADILEVIHAIIEYRGLSISDLEQVRLQKRAERGGFDSRTYLVEVKQNS
ncbi:MAG: nucleoside triphosphate pyrophosphohydrolase [Oscillospiraceae bacterium]|nr:nucleoside triphosphate pyrophosphohydrolase [Oscillospiraceae bacterium]